MAELRLCADAQVVLFGVLLVLDALDDVLAQNDVDVARKLQLLGDLLGRRQRAARRVARAHLGQRGLQPRRVVCREALENVREGMCISTYSGRGLCRRGSGVGSFAGRSAARCSL